MILIVFGVYNFSFLYGYFNLCRQHYLLRLRFPVCTYSRPCDLRPLSLKNSSILRPPFMTGSESLASVRDNNSSYVYSGPCDLRPPSFNNPLHINTITRTAPMFST